jgi:hypothetical protein
MDSCPYCTKKVKDTPRHVRYTHGNLPSIKYLKMFGVNESFKLIGE